MKRNVYGLFSKFATLCLVFLLTLTSSLVIKAEEPVDSATNTENTGETIDQDTENTSGVTVSSEPEDKKQDEASDAVESVDSSTTQKQEETPTEDVTTDTTENKETETTPTDTETTPVDNTTNVNGGINETQTDKNSNAENTPDGVIETATLDEDALLMTADLEDGGQVMAEGVAKVNDSDTVYTTLQDAINDANEGDTVTLLSDVNENITVNKVITLNLNNHTITGNDGSVIAISIESAGENNKTLTVKNGTVTGGKNAKQGGGINFRYTNKPDSLIVKLESLTIKNNSAETGAGIFVSSGVNSSYVINIDNCTITENNLTSTSKGSGAGLDLNNGSEIKITNSTISNNDAADGNGGGICSSFSTLYINDTTISENVAGSTGGGICASTGTTLSMEKVNIKANKAKSNGGGVFAVSSTIESIKDCEISENVAGYDGGGLYFRYSTLLYENSLSDSKVINNTASWGGGFSLNNCKGVVYIPTNLVVNNNTAKNYGASDIYSTCSELTLYKAAEGTLSCDHSIEGWYWDAYNGTQWVAHNESGKYYVYKYADNVSFSNKSTVFLKAAHGLASLEVNYLYEDETKAAESVVVAQIEYGKAYNYNSPIIAGYTPDQATVSGTIQTKENVINVIYKKALHNLTVNYVYEGGTTATPAHTETVEYGKTYSVDSPIVEGYTADTDTVSGTMADEDVTVTVTYKKNTYSFKVTYTGLPEGTEGAPENIVETKSYGDKYEYVTPVIPGYTADIDVVEGTVSDDVDITVTYKVNSHDLTVNYVYEDGTTATPAHTETVEYGKTYSVDSPIVEGYTADTDTVSGTMADEDVTVTVTYKQNKVAPTPSISDNNNADNSGCPSGTVWNEYRQACVLVRRSTTYPTYNNYPTSNDDNNQVTINDNTDVVEDDVDTKVVTPEEVVIEEEETPLVGGKRAWALINLIATCLTILTSLILLLSKHSKDDDEEYEDEKNVTYMETSEDEEQEELTRRKKWKVINPIISIISIIVFILTENMRLPMVLVDKWTLLMIAILLVNVVTLYLGRKWHEPEEDEEENQAA